MTATNQDGADHPSSPGAYDSRARIWTVYLFFALSLIALLATTSMAVVAGYKSSYGSTEGMTVEGLARFATTGRMLIVSMWVTAATLIACTLIALRLSKVSLQQSFGRKFLCLSPGSLLLVMLGAPALGAVLEAFTVLIEVKPSGTLKLIADAVAQMHGAEMLLFAVGITVGPAFGEELMFRGYIQPRLVARYGVTTGIAVASALFGLLHMDALQSPLAGILGLYIGLVAYHTGSLWPAILTHGFNNLLSVASLYYFPDAERDTQASLITGALGLALFIYCLRYLLSTSVHRTNQRPSESLAER